MKKLGPILLLLLLFSCSPSSLADLRYEWESQTKKLVEELRSIDSKEDLQSSVPKLKKQFNKLADLLLQARSFPAEECEPTYASEELFAELARLYEMPGGRELIESSQAESIRRLR